MVCMTISAPDFAPEYAAVADAPRSDDYARLVRLRERLTALNYTYDAVQELLGANAADAMARDQVVPGIWRVEQILRGEYSAEQKNLARLLAFFLLARPLTEAEAAEVFGETLQDFAEASLIERDAAGRWTASVDLRPHAADDGTEIYVAADLGAHQRPGVLRKDHVLGIGHASLTLAQITERTPVERALDVGTGCGIQTFHLLAHARHVTATDISERALAFTRFNLLLNAPALDIDPQNPQDRVSLREGSLLDPVAGERFDLVVSNPPFVITPRVAGESAEEQFTYRDGGLPGDEIVSTMVRRLPSVLVPGGRAQMLGNWEIIRDSEDPSQPRSWDERVRAWVEDADAEAWIIQRETLSPESYAETWLKDASENRDRKHYEQTYLAYLNDFESRNVHSIGFGMTAAPPDRGNRGRGDRSPTAFRGDHLPDSATHRPCPHRVRAPLRPPRRHGRRGAPRRAPGGRRGRHRGTPRPTRRRAPERYSAACRIGSVPHPAALHRDGGFHFRERWRACRGSDRGGSCHATVLARIR